MTTKTVLFLSLFLLTIHSIKISLHQQENKVFATVTNTYDEQKCIFSSSLPNELGVRFVNIFAPESDVPVEYHGIIAKVRLDANSSSLVCLDVGESFTAEVPIDGHFLLKKDVDYEISFHGVIALVGDEEAEAHYVESESTMMRFSVDFVKSFSHEAALELGLELGQFTACSASERSHINAGTNRFVTVRQAALRQSPGNRVWNEWFGNTAAAQNNRVNLITGNIGRVPTSALRWVCNHQICGRDTYAFVYPNQHYTIYLCNLFFRQRHNGLESTAATIYHEVSHFTVIGGTIDIVYGQRGAQNLARTNPRQAVENADNHCYFAERAAGS